MSDETQNSIVTEYPYLYEFVSAHAHKQNLSNLLSLLTVVKDVTDGRYGNLRGRVRDDMYYLSAFHHSLSVCRMLIDLQIPLAPEDEDMLLTLSVAHVFPEAFFTDNLWQELQRRCSLDFEVFEMLFLIYIDENSSDSEKEAYFEKIRENEIAVLVKLADQSHLIELLFEYSSWSARSFIHETRNRYLPLCIFAKEHYPQIHTAINVLMQKMQNISLGAEILLAQYEARENELLQEILDVEEDNATLKRRIRELTGNAEEA